MANNPDIPNIGREQYLPQAPGERDRYQMTGYEGVLQRRERDKKMEKRVEDGRQPLSHRPLPTVEGQKTTPLIGDEPH